MIEPVPSNGHYEEIHDDHGNIEFVWVHDTALLCWPVRWNYEVNVESPHVTAFYFDNLTGLNKEDLLETVRDFFEGWGAVNVGGLCPVTEAAAFGPEQNVPVLKIELGLFKTELHKILGNFLSNHGIKFDTKWDYVPHTTVDLPTALDCPPVVRLGPMELWWLQDEPVVV